MTDAGGGEAWRVSRYVTCVELEAVDTTLVYGGLGGRLIELTGGLRRAGRALLADPAAGAPDELREAFVEQGILVPGELDEVALLEARREQTHRPDFGAVSLTLCPTVNCNFRCVYCFQHHLGRLMSPNVMDHVEAFVGQQSPLVSSLSITWFGGEPLLGLDEVIVPLTRRLRSMVPPGRYRATVISNGWLLTPEVSTRLVELGVRSVQVTLDGDRETHDARRPRAGGQATFDRILEHLHGADSRLGLSVRVNTDQRNVERVDALFEQLRGLEGRIALYFAPVVAYTEVCADTAGHCLAGEDWSQHNARLRLAAVQRGFGGPGIPGMRAGFCIADNPRGWVVTPDGKIYKCWNDVTFPDRAVGDLVTGERTPAMQHELARWRDWSPFKLSECRECKTLPQCHSGCPHIAMQQPGEITHGECSELKWNLPETLATYYLTHRRRELGQELVSIAETRSRRPEGSSTD